MKNKAKPKQKPAPKPVVDWMTLRNSFVFGTFDEQGNRHFPTLTEIAKSHGNVSVSRIHQVARRGNRSVHGRWTEERHHVQHRLAEAVDAKRTTATANMIAEAEARHLKLWTATEASASRKLFDVRDGGVVGFKQGLSVAETKGLVDVLRTAVAGVRMSLGIAETRMAIDESKAAVPNEASPVLLPPEIRDLPAAVRRDFLMRLGNELARSQSAMRERDERAKQDALDSAR